MVFFGYPIQSSFTVRFLRKEWEQSYIYARRMYFDIWKCAPTRISKCHKNIGRSVSMTYLEIHWVQDLVPNSDESDSDQMVRKKWNEHNLVYIYYKQCEIKNFSDFPMNFCGMAQSAPKLMHANSNVFFLNCKKIMWKLTSWAFQKCNGFLWCYFLNRSYGSSMLGQISKMKMVDSMQSICRNSHKPS